jgi:hypothetical protein
MEVTSFGGTLLAQYAKEVACQVPHQTLSQLPSHEISCDFHYLMHHIVRGQIYLLINLIGQPTILVITFIIIGGDSNYI